MKGFKLAAAAGAVAIGLGAISAATANTVTFNLQGEVGGICVVTSPNGDTETVDFGLLSLVLNTTTITQSFDLDYTCNMSGGFTRLISSANSGDMVRAAGNPANPDDRISYQVMHTGSGESAALAFAWDEMTADITDGGITHGPYAGTRTETITFRTTGVVDPTTNAPTKNQGDYGDTLTLTITAN